MTLGAAEELPQISESGPAGHPQTIASSIPLFTETRKRSCFFLKKEPLRQISKGHLANRQCL
jgi:hypothetical protein